MKKLTLLLAALLLTATNVIAHGAAWSLDNTNSSIHFVSIKKDSIGELHHFKALEGDIDHHGNASLIIDLSSVETNIPIRNQRMQNLLFNTAKFAKAVVSMNVDVKQLKAMQAGETRVLNVKAELSLSGVKKTIDATVQVLKNNNSGVTVTTLHPIIVNATDFGLEPGVKALQKIAGLPSIATSVPVTFNLVFVP